MHVVWEGKLVRIRPFKSSDEMMGLLEELALQKDEHWGYGWWMRLTMEKGFEEHSQISHSIPWSVFAVDRLDTGELVGYEVLLLPKPFQINAEVGTVILQRHWRCGFGRDAKRLATCALFENFPLERVDATTLETHSRARAGLEACGFKLEGIWSRSAFTMGKWAGIAKYAIFREEWEKWEFRNLVKRGITPADDNQSSNGNLGSKQ